MDFWIPWTNSRRDDYGWVCMERWMDRWAGGGVDGPVEVWTDVGIYGCLAGLMGG